MKKSAFIIFLLLCFVLQDNVLCYNKLEATNNSNGHIAVEGQYIIRFTDQIDLKPVSKGFGMFRFGVPSVEKVLDEFSTEKMRPLFRSSIGKSNSLSRYYLVNIEKGKDGQKFYNALKANPYILSIDQDVICPVHSESNDPDRGNQWWIFQSDRVDIHTREAWDIEAGSDTAVIAIIDTGINYEHDDLRNNIWVNPGEDIDNDGVVFDSTDFNNNDDDGNGYKDDVIGYDFISSVSADVWPGEDGSTPDNNPMDFNGHGTHCAGIAAASTNNSIGGCGVAGGWGKKYTDRGARIMCLRAGYSGVHPDHGNEQGYLMMSAVAEAIEYAAANGAHVINFSAGSHFSGALFSAMTEAMDSGLVFCKSAGNDSNTDSDYLNDFNGVLSVASTNSYDRKSSFSSYGPWVEISAPGSNIYSTYSDHNNPTYDYLNGTSMASPMVAGLAGLIKSHYPDFDKTVIDTLIMNRADALTDTYYISGDLGSGRINAYNCLMDAPVAKFEASPRVGFAPLTVDFTDISPDASSWSWSFGDGGVSTDQNPTNEFTSPGLYTVSLEVTDPNGTDTEIKKAYIYASADSVFGESSMIAKTSDPLGVTLYIKNDIPLDKFIIPVKFPDTGSPNLDFDSISSVGTRSEDFDDIFITQSSNKVILIFTPALTTAKNALPPGSGPIITIWFSAHGDGQLVIDTTSYGGSYFLGFESRFVDFQPAWEPISIFVTMYDRGDANGDQSVNLGDVINIINYIFKGGLGPIDLPLIYAGDANGDGGVNIGDAIYLINYIFKGGLPPPP